MASRALPKGVSVRGDRLRVVVWVGNRSKEGTIPVRSSDREIRAKQRELIGILEAAPKVVPLRALASNTFEDVCDRYLLQIKGAPDARSAEGRCNNWIGILGANRKPTTISAEDLRVALRAWASARRRNPLFGIRKGAREWFKPMAPQTLRHHLRTLRKAFQFANEAAKIIDDKTTNPARLVRMEEIEAPADPASREIELFAVMAILRRVRVGSDTRARLFLMITGGLRPCEIKRITKADIDFRRGLLTVHSVKKGGGTRTRVLPIDEMRGLRASLRNFVRRGCYGKFSQSSVYKSFRLAAANAGYAEQASGVGGWRPYDLRHTLATNLARESGDEGATQDLLGHTTRGTTRRYTLGAAPQRVINAFRTMNRKAPRLVRKAG